MFLAVFLAIIGSVVGSVANSVASSVASFLWLLTAHNLPTHWSAFFFLLFSFNSRHADLQNEAEMLS